MIEILLILVVIYVGYVIYSDSASAEKSNNEKVDGEVSFKSPVTVTVSAPVTQQSSAENTKSTKADKPKPKTKTNKLAAPKIELRTVMMKNPATGEEAKVAGSYRMVKRWIKEALVEEGLLEKIYKNNELDDAAKVVVAEALSIIKAMDKYKV